MNRTTAITDVERLRLQKSEVSGSFGPRNKKCLLIIPLIPKLKNKISGAHYVPSICQDYHWRPIPESGMMP